METRGSSCRVGLVGSGKVGGGVAEVLLARGDLLESRTGVRLELARVAEKDAGRAREAGVPDAMLTDDYRQLVADPGVDVVVELVGGTGVAKRIVEAALEAGKPVVTANKALLAEAGRPLFDLARRRGASIAFEASVCGGIPLLLALREGLVANRCQGLLGIVNGTCNHILSSMAGQGLAFGDALREAQRLGFAEADPATDIDGTDSGHKLALLSALAFETWIDWGALHVEGIRNVPGLDVRLAAEMGYTLKLLACARPEPVPGSRADGDGDGGGSDGRLFLSVHPALLRRDHPLASVSGSMNGVMVRGDVAMEGAYYGRGAGRYPTASAVVADLAQVARARASGRPDLAAWWPRGKPLYRLAPMGDYRARYYLRFLVADRPGVLARMAGALGARGLSIAGMRQWEADAGAGHGTEPDRAMMTIMTHMAREDDVRAALDEINGMDFLPPGEKPVTLRVEE